MVGVHVCVLVNMSSWAPVELWLPCLCCFLLLAVICGLCPKGLCGGGVGFVGQAVPPSTCKRGGPLNHALGKDLLSMTSYGKVESLVGGYSLGQYYGMNWVAPHFVLRTPPLQIELVA